MLTRSLLRITVAAVLVLAAGQAQATLFTTTSNSTFTTLGNNQSTGSVMDQVNWGAFAQSLGNTSVEDKTIQDYASVAISSGERVTAQSGDGGSFTTFIEGGANWQGDFRNATTILFTTGNSITLKFSTALIGIGVDAQTADTGAYTVTLSAYDSASDLLGTISNSGTSTGTGPNGVNTDGPGGTANEGTVPFVGVATDSTAANVATTGISYVTISVTSAGGDGFAIDTSLLYHYAIQGPAGPTATPEPGTLGLLGVGLSALWVVRRRRSVHPL